MYIVCVCIQLSVCVCVCMYTVFVYVCTDTLYTLSGVQECLSYWPRGYTHTHTHTHTHTMDSGKVQGIGTCVPGPGQFRMDHESLVQWLHRMVLAGVVGFVMCVVYWCSIR